MAVLKLASFNEKRTSYNVIEIKNSLAQSESKIFVNVDQIKETVIC